MTVPFLGAQANDNAALIERAWNMCHRYIAAYEQVKMMHKVSMKWTCMLDTPAKVRSPELRLPRALHKVSCANSNEFRCMFVVRRWTT